MMIAFHAVLAFAPLLPRVIRLLVGCLPGMALEWFVIGNSPWGNPDAMQPGQIAFHGTYPNWGRIFDPAWFGPRQRRLRLILLAAVTLGLAPGFLIADQGWRFAFFIFLPLGFCFALALIALFNRPRET